MLHTHAPAGTSILANQAAPAITDGWFGAKRDKTMRWYLSASLLLHAGLLLALIFQQPAAVPKSPGEQPVDVVLVKPSERMEPVTTEDRLRPALDKQQEAAPMTAADIIRAARNHAAEKLPEAAAAHSQPLADALISATHLYAASLLADRHNRSAREAMKTLAGDEHMIQLCDIEAMEQVRHARAALKPDYVIAYAMAGLKLSDGEVDAEGGAFLSHRNWYGLKFRCNVSPTGDKVTSFAFLVGEPIPRSEWAAHDLTADAGSDD